MTTRPHDVGVVYLLTHMQLAARLVVSIHSLRRWYSGPVTILTTRAESEHIAKLCVDDARLRVDHISCPEVPGSDKFPGEFQSAYLTKSACLEYSPYSRTVFLDADTLVVAPIDELLEAANNSSLVVTRFSDETTQTEPLRTRLNMWRDVECDFLNVSETIDDLHGAPFPHVNTGVFAIEKDTDLLDRWAKLAKAGRDCPLPDEVAMQLLLWNTSHVMLPQGFNCGPDMQLEPSDVVIWHFACTSHLKEPGIQIWLPEYELCRTANLAKMQTWSRVGAPTN